MPLLKKKPEELKRNGSRIRKMRIASRMTQAELGAALGFSKQFMCAVEKGRKDVPRCKTELLKSILKGTRK